MGKMGKCPGRTALDPHDPKGIRARIKGRWRKKVASSYIVVFKGLDEVCVKTERCHVEVL